MTFKVINGGGPSREERERSQAQEELARRREWAEGVISSAIRECAANMLRVIRGAGNPHDLLLQMEKVVEASIRFHEVHGYLPGHVIADKLHLRNERYERLSRSCDGDVSQALSNLWREDGTFDRMSGEYTALRGALQIIASRMIGQKAQESAGSCEFDRGLREMQKIQEKNRRRIAEEARAMRSIVRGEKTVKKRKLRPPKPPVIL